MSDLRAKQYAAEDCAAEAGEATREARRTFLVWLDSACGQYDVGTIPALFTSASADNTVDRKAFAVVPDGASINTAMRSPKGRVRKLIAGIYRVRVSWAPDPADETLPGIVRIVGYSRKGRIHSPAIEQGMNRVEM